MIDFIILGFVIIVISLIIYFRFIKNENKGTCNCYKSKTCGLKVDDLKDLFKDYELNK